MTRISTRIDPELKAQAETVLKKIGVKPSQVISMFYSQIAREQSLPLNLNLPTKKLLKP